MRRLPTVQNLLLFKLTAYFDFRPCLLLPVLTCIVLYAALAYGVDIEEDKRILVLFPAQSDLPAFPIVEKSIKSSLASGAEFRIEYFIEYMDLYRNADETYNRLLLDLFHHKFAKHKIDLVIAWGTQSLNFVYLHEKDLFKKVPVVFSGVSRSEYKGLRLNERTTGMFVDIEYKGLLETALKVHPQTRNVVVVNGASRSDKLVEKEVRTALAPYAEQYTFTYLTGLPIGEIQEKVQSLPKNTVILYYVITQDGAGKGFKPYDAAKIVAEAANVPVYGCLDSYLGSGIVGGRMISLEITGTKAGEMARRILQGENPANITITSKGTTDDLFDWRQFKRFGITEDRLPPRSTVLFKEYSFWELYRNYVLLGFCIIVVQSALIAFLIYQRVQRRRAESKYRTVADFTYNWEYWANLDGSIEYVSPSCERISGYTTRAFLENPSLFSEIIVPEDRDARDRLYEDCRRELKPQEMQFRIRRRDGEIRWIEHNCQPVIDTHGHLQGFRASNRDITSRKQAEELLRQNQKDLSRLAGRIISTQEEELQRLSREIHDDLTQRLASLALDAALIEKQINPTQLSRAVEDLKGLRINLSEVADQVHDLSRRLHPSVLDDLGLAQAVQAESAAFKTKTEINLSISIEGLPDSVHPQSALSLYRVTQEGLQNIAKHSGAKSAAINLQGLADGIHLAIEDNGVGFDPQEVRKKAGIGLSSMRERVQLLNGTISFASKPGQGTKIEVFIPTKEAP